MKEYTHYKEKVNLKLLYMILLVLLALYGFYKNGLIYYFKGQITFFESLRPLMLSFSGFLVGFIVDFLFYHGFKKNYLLGFLVSNALPYQMSIWLAGLIIGVVLTIFEKFKLTFSPIYILLVILIFINSNYTNIIESNNEIFYKTIDVFLGQSVGGVGITNIMLLLIGLLVFCFSFYYKREIPLISLGVFVLLTGVVSISKVDSNLFLNIFNSSVFYITIFLLPFNEYSPLVKKDQIIYGIILGIIIFVGSCYNSIYGPFIGVFIGNTLFYLIEVLSKKREIIAKV